MRVSSPDKVLFPDVGVTKAEVVAHYERWAEALLSFARGRPLTLQRFPQGIQAKGFMQKNAADHFPDSIERVPVPKRGGGHTTYPVVHHAADIAYLANQNTVTFHMWLSTSERPGRPDWMVIDLDPEDGDLDGARLAAMTVREVLIGFEVEAFAVATGSKGFHVWVPLADDLDYGSVALASRSIAGLATIAAPDRLTTEFLKRERHGRVFVDWLRNGPTATVVCPYSLRPRAGAPVAVPLRWDDLPTADPQGVRIGDVERIGAATAVPGAVPPQSLPVDTIESEARRAGVDLDTPHDRFGRR